MRRALVAACLPLLAACLAADIHPRAGTTAWTFLKIGAGARYAALADAGAALADDATACHWNPARLSAIERTWAAQVQHHAWIDDTAVDELYLAAGRGRHRLGLSARLFSSGDIPLRGGTPTAEPDGYFSVYDLSGGLSYAFAPVRQVSAGITFRSLYEKIHLDAAYGWSLDGGLSVSPVDGLTLAGVAANVGPRMRMRRDLFRLPATFTLAAAYALPWTAWHGRFNAALAGVKPVDGALQVRCGAEYWWRNLAAGRLGYKTGHDTESFSAGTGVRWRWYTLDYAFVPHRDGLGTAHRVSLDLRF